MVYRARRRRDPPTDRCWNAIWNLPVHAVGVVARRAVHRSFLRLRVRPAELVAMTTSPTASRRRVGLLAGTLDLARRVALSLNAHGKVPIFFSPSFLRQPEAFPPFWLRSCSRRSKAPTTCSTTNSSARARERAACCELGVPMGVHTYLNSPTLSRRPSSSYRSRLVLLRLHRLARRRLEVVAFDRLGAASAARRGGIRRLRDAAASRAADDVAVRGDGRLYNKSTHTVKVLSARRCSGPAALYAPGPCSGSWRGRTATVAKP